VPVWVVIQPSTKSAGAVGFSLIVAFEVNVAETPSVCTNFSTLLRLYDWASLVATMR
jgi:hypothetical protein